MSDLKCVKARSAFSLGIATKRIVKNVHYFENGEVITMKENKPFHFATKVPLGGGDRNSFAAQQIDLFQKKTSETVVNEPPAPPVAK